MRQLYSTFIGYAIFYFVRKNLSCAFPGMEKELKIGKAQMGAFLTTHSILYGVSKFLNGILADRSDPRRFMVFGLICSALANYCFGFSPGLMVLGVVWVLNGWFQGMGFPPCARILSHWFARGERGLKWGLWNTSHMAGGALILVLGSWLAEHYGWRAAFYVPATIALLTSVFLWNRLRDTPESLGLPDVEVYMSGESALPGPGPIGAPSDGEPGPIGAEAPDKEPFWETLRTRVFTNPLIWAICFANFFVYVVRYVYFDWWPTYLHQQRDFPIGEAGRITAMFEVAGLFGSLIAGFLSDRLFAGKRNVVCLGYLVATFVCILGYSRMPRMGFWEEAVAVCLVGFFIYGPQFLVGVMVTDLASKEAAASAIGLTGFFGYLSSVASGWGLGMLVDRYGWNVSFHMTLICTACAFVCFAVCGRKT